MELKQKHISFSSFPVDLLIVPYGIETSVAIVILIAVKSLLIVPYGIETHSSNILI